MVVYYKATRPDGTDFRTETVDYAAALATGAMLVHPLQPVADEASTYFSVSTEPDETLIGGRWPCRLFEVEIDPNALASRVHPSKACTKWVRVNEELPAWRALGPNGEATAAFIADVLAWNATWSAALHASREAAWSTARHAARDAARDATRAACRDVARNAAWSAVRGTVGGARGAARDAIGALIVQDLIASEQFDALMRPWRILIGEDS